MNSRFRFPWVLALLLIASLLALVACEGDGATATPTVEAPTAEPTRGAAPVPLPSTPTPQSATPEPRGATPTPTTPKPTTPPATSTPRPATPTPRAVTPIPEPTDTELSTVDQLKQNAAEFEYEIGYHGGSYRFATVSEPLTFNPAIANDASSSGVLSYVFEGLTETSWLDDRVEPALAESWEHSEDGLTWTFHLRQDVRWHDGQPFTAHDVDFTFNRITYNHDIASSDSATFHFRVQDKNGGWQESPMTVRARE